MTLEDAVHDALSHLQVGHVALDDMEDLHDARQRRLLQLRLPPPRPRLRRLRVLLLPRCAASSGTARCVLSPSSSHPPAAPPAAPLPPTPSSMAWVIQSSRRRGSAHSGLERRSSDLDRRPTVLPRPLRSPRLTPIRKPSTHQLGQFRPLSRARPARHAPGHAHVGSERVIL